ncbi:MAG: hypothetical protein ACRCWQ_02740 [Bacilli bacterium]
MESVLEAIKTLKPEFISTIHCRSMTTPSERNRRNHQDLMLAVMKEKWGDVTRIITLPEYHEPLGGVVYCLQSYSDIKSADWHKICSLYENGDIL